MNRPGGDAQSNTVLEHREKLALRENNSLNALELLAQMPKGFHTNEQPTQYYIDKNALPSLTLEDKSYLPGYTYSKTEAEAHKKEILQSENMSESDMNFMRAMLKQENKEQEKHSSDVTRWSGAKPHSDKTDGSTLKNEPAIDQHKFGKFELSTEAEGNAWKEWQVRLNKQISQALDKLVKDGQIPLGAKGSASYTVAADGRFVFSCVAKPAAYARVIAAALNRTFNNHRDLLKFPEGAHKQQITRSPEFSVGSYTSVTTGAVDDEVIKK